MIELMIVIAVVGILASVALFHIKEVRAAAAENKLTNDIAVLNSAVQTYRSMGGEFPGNSTVDSVLSALKSVGKQENIPGFSGSLIDARLDWRKQTAKEAASDQSRVIWNAASQRFEISYQGDAGIAFFELRNSDEDSTLEVAEASAELKTPFTYGKSSGWIWDYSDEPTKDTTSMEPTKVTLSGSTVQQNSIPVSLQVNSGSPGGLAALKAPIITFPSGVYPDPGFTVSILLANPNPDGVSEILFSIDYGPWTKFNGTPITLNSGEVIVTKTDSKDTSQWADSQFATEKFEVLVAAAETAGSGSAPASFEVASLGPVYGTGTSGTAPSTGSLALSKTQALTQLQTPDLAFATSSLESAALQSPSFRATTLNFGDPGVSFVGTGNHYYFNIGGTDAKMGIMVGATSNISEASLRTADNGDRGAFWISNSPEKAGAEVALDFFANPVTQVGFRIYFSNVADPKNGFKLAVQTDRGTVLKGNSKDLGGSTMEYQFSAPQGELITTVQMKWEHTPAANGYHGVGLGKINFTYQPKTQDLSLTEVSQ